MIRPSHTFRPAQWITLFLLVSVLASGCVTGTSLITGNKRAYGYTWAQEVQMGQEADASIVAEYGLYDDADLTRYVDSLGQELVRNSHARRLDTPQEIRQTPFHFRVLDSPVVNAFALPGGYVYITRGLLAHTVNEAQLAVVIGHEIGHVVGRHASIRAANQTFGQALLLGGAVGGQVLFGGNTAETVLQGGSAAAQLMFLSYGRDDERESDRLGVEYASLTGYDAREGAAFFRTLKRLTEQSGQEIPSFLSTHPDPGEREQTIIQLATEWAGNKVQRNNLMAKIDGIVVGENPRSGFVRSGTFFHPDLAFQFPVPSGYQTANQPTQVVMVAEDQASAIRFSIASGVSSAQQAAQQFASQEGLTVVQSGMGSANGLPARYVIVDAAGSDGSVTRARAQYVEYSGNVYAFLGLAAQQNYAQREAGFVQTMQGFAPLRDQSILQIQPSHLAVSRNHPSGAFSSLPGVQSAGSFTVSDLAIMNQVEASEMIPAGMALKLVR